MPIQIAGTTVDVVINCGASGLVVGQTIACRMGIWKRARKINIRQADGTKIRSGHYMVNTSFIFLGTINGLNPITIESLNLNINNYTNCHTSSNRFLLDAEVFDIGHKDVVLGLS